MNFDDTDSRDRIASLEEKLNHHEDVIAVLQVKITVFLSPILSVLSVKFQICDLLDSKTRQFLL
jgi:hypothetical protein